jgi:hypothetical protein
LTNDLKSLEYFDGSIGRVLYQKKRERFLIYADKALFKIDIKAKVRQFFNITDAPVKWLSDPHYLIDADGVGRLFDD